MCDLTVILTNPRFAQVRVADRYVLVQLYFAPWLLTAPLKVLAASLCKTEKATLNFLTRVGAAGCLTGEVGGLQTTEAYAWITASSSAPGTQEQPERAPRPQFPSDIRRNEQRRQERGGVMAESWRTTPADSARMRASSGTGFGFGSDSESKTESGPEPERAEMVHALQSIGMEETPARERVKEFGPRRVREALEALRWKETQEEVKSPVGYVVDFLVEEWPLPSGVYAMREQAEKKRRMREEAEKAEQTRQKAIAETEEVVARAQALQAAKRAAEGGGNGQVERVVAGPV